MGRRYVRHRLYMVRPVQAGSVKPRRPVSTPGRTHISENLPASRKDKIPDAVQNDLEAQGKAAPAEKKEKPPVGETVGFRMARQFAETEPGFKDFIMALADKLSNG